ncbi:MAG TPA: winged helix DNA-binding domain-containing protein [Flavitalea sp.]|nr:winged helix DNA-binding domain-containing protein [Flavitalea sp.]
MKLLLPYRLAHQQISQQQFSSPAQVVQHFGVMQAQDYAGAKWAVALRIPGATQALIEKALNEAKIIRSWSCRCTWQFMTPEDIRWILDLVKPRLKSMYAGYYRKLEIDEKVITKSKKLFEVLLRDGKALTRNQCRIAFEKKGIQTNEMRLGFILLRAALDALICQGPMQGKQFTFVLLDEWTPATKKITREEALSWLILRYFTSHGPATIADCSWWSGLTQSDVKSAIDSCGKSLQSISFNDKQYFTGPPGATIKNGTDVYLLPAFDEYLVAYKDRSEAVPAENVREILGAGNGIFSPVIVMNGKVVGTWKRNVTKNSIQVETKLFNKISKLQESKLKTCIKKYKRYLEL